MEGKMDEFRVLWQRVKRLFEGAVERQIKDVDGWDGAASGYESTEAYCDACLIDVNEAAGRDEKAQSHCMLPVREAGDGAGVFVRQAVFAASGGRGIGQVSRPDDVPQEDWDAAVKKAANELISAYGQMDAIAPEAVYKLAGKERPAERSFVKETPSWDGDPARWQDAGSYCDACLVNLNAAAGRPERADWQKDCCMLPVRGAGDGDGVLVANALKTAGKAGRFEQLHKPDGVSDEAWSEALRKAARKLLRHYAEMGEEAPDHLYALANQTPPAPAEEPPSPETTRALGISDVYTQVQQLLQTSVDGEMEAGPMDPTGPYLVDLYIEEGAIMAILNKQGKLLKAPLSVTSNVVTMGEPQEVEATFKSRAGGMAIMREADGGRRWFGIVGTNVINRSGEIDSAKLYQTLVDRFKADPAPEVLLDFFHEGPLVMGKVDWLETDGHTLVASGLLSKDSPLADAFEEAIVQKRGAWGASIAFEAEEPEAVEVVAGVTIPVYTAGVLQRIAVLPEASAAALFTQMGMGVNRMRKDVEAALVTLFGDEAKAKDFIKGVDETNRSIDEGGLVTRGEPPTEPVTAPVEEPLEEVIGRAVAAALAGIPTVDLTPLQEGIASLGARLDALETAEQTRGQIVREDLPTRPVAPSTFRPRDQRSAGGPPDMAAIAQASLGKMRPLSGS